MEKIKYDSEIIGFISLINTLTKAKIKDCFRDNNIFYLIVEEGEMMKILGKNGIKIQQIQNLLNKKIRVIKFSPSPEKFFRDLIFPLDVGEIEVKDKSLIVKCLEKKTKNLLIGRGKKHLNWLKRLINRYFDLKEIKVV